MEIDHFLFTDDEESSLLISISNLIIGFKKKKQRVIKRTNGSRKSQTGSVFQALSSSAPTRVSGTASSGPALTKTSCAGTPGPPACPDASACSFLIVLVLRCHRDTWARLQRQIVAIDAVHFKQRRDQYNMISVRRELNKVIYPEHFKEASFILFWLWLFSNI